MSLLKEPIQLVYSMRLQSIGVRRSEMKSKMLIKAIVFTCFREPSEKLHFWPLRLGPKDSDNPQRLISGTTESVELMNGPHWIILPP